MTTEMTEVEVWIMIDANGEYWVGKDESEIELTTSVATRLVKITLQVPTPKPIELTATVPPEPACGELKVV